MKKRAQVVELNATEPRPREPGEIVVLGDVFSIRDETERLIGAYRPPEMFEDAMEREAAVYRVHPARRVVPFVAWLLARGIGRVEA